MTDEKLIEKVSEIIRQADEKFEVGSTLCIKYPESLMRKHIIQCAIDADIPRLEDALHVLSIGLGHPDPEGELGINGSDEAAVEEAWLRYRAERNPCPFKDGDVIVNGDSRYADIGIFKERGNSRYEGFVHITRNGYLLRWYENGTSFMWLGDNTRLATDGEKQHLFDAMAKEGLRWNPDAKRVEKLERWMAKDGEKFYYISATLHVLECQASNQSMVDSTFYAINNYFKTKEAAERVAKQIREIFKNSKAE